MNSRKKLLIPVAAFACFTLAFLFYSGCLYLTCEEIGCGKYGNCEKGMCRCDEGWDGLACTSEITPVRICVKKVKVVLLPKNLNKGINGGETSENLYPDLILRLWRLNSPLEPLLDGFDENDFGGVLTGHNPLLPAEFELNSGNGGCLSFPTRDYRLAVYNDEGPAGFDSGDPLLGGVTFIPYTEGKEFPNPIVVQNSKVIFELEAEYVFP